MSIITRFLSAVTEPEYKLARDLTAMAIADGEVTPEEKEAMSTICHLEGIDESKLLESLRGGYENIHEEMPNSRQEKEVYLRDVIRLIGADGYSAPQEVYRKQNGVKPDGCDWSLPANCDATILSRRCGSKDSGFIP